MKITEISKEYLEKGGLIRRKVWDSNISIGLSTSKNDFIYYENSKPKKPTTFLRGLVQDIMADDWELNEKPTQTWKPEFGEKYYYMTTSGNVAQDTFNTSFDKYRLSFRNVFKTAEEARKMVEKIKIINKLRELSNVDFNSTDDNAYVIGYDRELKKIQINFHDAYNELPFNIHFETAKDCQAAIDTIGVENLKKYYFDVKEEK